MPLLIAVLPESVRFLVLRGGQGAGIARILSRIGGTRVPANASFELIEPAVQARHSARSLFSGGFAVLTSRLWLSYFMGLLIIYLLTGWLPTLMRDAGFSIERAAFITGIFQIGGSVGSVGIGYVMDRVDRRRVVGASYAIGAVCVLLLGFLAISPGLFLVVLLLCGIFLSGAQTGMNALAPMSYPTAMRATGASWMLGIGRCGGITGSLIGGPLLAMGLSSGNLFSLLAVPAAVAAAGMLDARLELFASQPRALSSFYASTFGLAPRTLGESITCSAPGRALVLIPGEGGQLRRACFRFARRASFHAHRELLIARGLVLLEDLPGGFTVCDPEGRQISFLAPTDSVRAAPAATLEARLQHFGVRSPTPSALADYYVGTLGFVLSDRVLDENGELTAAFLRTDAEHHSMAIFRAPAIRFDHFSCEAPGWHQLREWADHMAEAGIDLAWGIGRHGPGNDSFLMVKDPEGNLAEISCDLEVCASDRPTGVWPHRPQTLNRWGVALMRS